MDNQNQAPNSQQSDEIINPNINTTLPPTTSNVQANNAQDAIVLSDTGYMQNVFQKSVTATRLNLTLYNTHLRIDNADTGELIEDAPLNQIVRTSRYFSNRLTYGLYTSLFSNVLVIKTDKKKYKISWVNKDKQTLLMPHSGPEIVAQENYTRNMKWVKAIKDLQGKT